MPKYVEDGAASLAICNAVMFVPCMMFCHTCSMVVSIAEKISVCI